MNIKECHVILDQSQRRISYVHLCKNSKNICSRLLRLEDSLRGHHFYFKAAKLAIEVSFDMDIIFLKIDTLYYI